MGWIIDAHCHLDDEAYDATRADVLRRLEEEEVAAVINPGCDLATSQKAVELARTSPRVFAYVGTHPHEAQYYTAETEQLYRALAKEPRVVAIGEIGLDYHYDFSPRDVQRAVFERQLQVAQDLDLPVVIHSREAAEDTYAILRNFGSSIRALMHSYSETPADWEKLADFGYYLSLGGMVTFKNAKNPKALAQAVAADRLLLETDGPYLAPVPYRGKTNLPWYAHQTAQALAALRGATTEEIENATRENAVRFYHLPDLPSPLR